MTDEEVICAWMEKRPADGHGAKVDPPESRWWVYRYDVRDMGFYWSWHPPILTLVHMHEVEARLTDAQWASYLAELYGRTVRWITRCGAFDLSDVRSALHTSPEQKIKALAEVIKNTAGVKQ